jgi:hypothetical protein
VTVGYVSHSDCGRHDTGWGHPEHVGRIRTIPRALREDAEPRMTLVLAQRDLELLEETYRSANLPLQLRSTAA